MYVVIHVPLETVRSWCKKGGVSWAGTARVHSVPKDEIEQRTMPKPSECVGATI